MTDSKKIPHLSMRTIPLYAFNHPGFSMRTRIVLAYMSLAGKDGVATIGSRSVMKLVGYLPKGEEEDEEAKRKALMNFRSERSRAVEGGYLEAVCLCKETNSWGYRVLKTEASAVSVAEWNRIGKGKVFYSAEKPISEKEGKPTPISKREDTSPSEEKEKTAEDSFDLNALLEEAPTPVEKKKIPVSPWGEDYRHDYQHGSTGPKGHVTPREESPPREEHTNEDVLNLLNGIEP